MVLTDEIVSTLSSEFRDCKDWPRLRPVGISVEMLPFFVGRGGLVSEGD